MSSTTSKVAILGAGGLTGQFAVNGLLDRDVDVRAVLRQRAYTDRLPAEVDFAEAEFDDVDALCEAFRGCAAVYLIPPSFNEGEERFAKNIIAAMTRAGVKRFIYHSVLHPATPGMPHHQRKSRVELIIRESDLVWTILQPAMYVQTVLSFLSPDGEALRPPFDPDRPFNLITPNDLIDALVRVLTDDGTAFATFELAGIERLSLRQMAEQLSVALGRPIGIEVSGMDEIVASRAAKRGWSEHQQGEYRAMLAYYDRYGLPGNGLTLEMLIGRPPSRFAVAAKALLYG